MNEFNGFRLRRKPQPMVCLRCRGTQNRRKLSRGCRQGVKMTRHLKCKSCPEEPWPMLRSR